MNWWKCLKGRVKLNEPLRTHTTFGIGGSAKFFIEPRNEEDLKSLLNILKRYNISFLVMGAGSNILVCDKGVGGVVLRLSSPYFKKIKIRDNHIEAGAGASLGSVINQAKEHGLSGLEFLVAIPGTMGGALTMNAGAWDRNIGDLVETVRIMDYNGNIVTLNKNDIKFGYRASSLTRYIILSSCIKLIKRKKSTVKNRIKKYLDLKRSRQDLSVGSAGCIFKNPKGHSAGRLIDLCGLKGKRIGGAFISEKHANFIINRGNAKSRDILKLVALVKKRVKHKFNIILEPEIKIWR